jgi:hypothetical protein
MPQMNPLTKIVFALLVVCMLSIAASAEVSWDTSYPSYRASLTESSVIFAYPFRNNGTAPVSFLSIRPSCGCTAIDDLKDSYYPGETGVLKARVTTAGSGGWEQKGISVVTDDESSSIHTLKFRLYVPRVSVQPLFVRWNRDTTSAERRIRIRVSDIEPNEIQEPEESSGNFEINVSRRTPDEMEIVVKPILPDMATNSQIFITVTDFTGNRATYRVPLIVE